MKANVALALAALAGGSLLLAPSFSDAMPSRRLLFGRPPRGTFVEPIEAALDAWELSGPHDAEIPEHGGLRTSQALQASLAGSSQSKAKDLASTPHGRGAAVDLWPVGYREIAYALTWEQVPREFKDAFQRQGEFAEAHGLEWGGRWRSATFPNGDQPHWEVPDWSVRFPFPPVERSVA